MKTQFKGILAFSMLLASASANAATTVTVDDNNQVQVNQTTPQTVVVREVPVTLTQPVIVQPVVLVDSSLDFEGEIERMNHSTRTIDVIDTEGRTRQVLVAQETIDAYRPGDFVRIHPMANVREVTFMKEESNRDLEGRIIQVDSPHNTILVHDAQGRDRRVMLKQGMISGYKVDDYVRIHLMADLKEAKMIRTIKN